MLKIKAVINGNAPEYWICPIEKRTEINSIEDILLSFPKK